MDTISETTSDPMDVPLYRNTAIWFFYPEKADETTSVRVSCSIKFAADREEYPGDLTFAVQQIFNGVIVAEENVTLPSAESEVTVELLSENPAVPHDPEIMVKVFTVNMDFALTATDRSILIEEFTPAPTSEEGEQNV